MAQLSTYELGLLIANEAQARGIDPRVGVEQLRRESVGFSPYYVYGPGKSPAGAQGLAQFIPGTWARFGSGSAYDPHQAVKAWGKYMSYLLGMFGGRIDIALAAYNSGEARAEYRSAAAQGRPINWAVMPAGVQRETKPYVNEILRAAGSPVSTVGAGTPPATTPTGGGLPTITSTGGDGSNLPVSVYTSTGGGKDEGDGGGVAEVAVAALVVWLLFF